jgi:DNA-binding NtrC family response regulator
MCPFKILVVEDNESLREVLTKILTTQGYETLSVDSAESGYDSIQQQPFDLVITDLKLPQMSGLELLRAAKERLPSLRILLMTAYGTLETAVEAMKLGAVDFISKPFEPEFLLNLVAGMVQSKKQKLRRRNHHLEIISQSSKMEALLKQARKIAALDVPVLILGESGTGKELLARYLHDQRLLAGNYSRAGELTNPGGELVAVNCGSIPADLLESEFFGHEAGAFTGAVERHIGFFELANNGTIFLDEIGNMPLALQVKLLRTLQESEIRRVGGTRTIKLSARVVSATNADLSVLMKERKFREDLYYRLSVMTLEIPPLRDRKEDIPLLARYIIRNFSETATVQRTISKDALSYLQEYDWPGNIRELENVLERALVFSASEITKADLEVSLGPKLKPQQSLIALGAVASKNAEVGAILQALQETKWNKLKAAKILGVSYKTLLNKIKDYNLSEIGSGGKEALNA